MKLALGTVQFGLEYGVANREGRVSMEAAAAIVRQARLAGMDTLDTAASYGDSEARLGTIGVADWRVVSKLPAVPDACDDVAAWVASMARESVARLNVPALHGLLLHRPEQLLAPGDERLFRALQQLKWDGVVGKIGVSIYEPSELDAIWGRFPCDIVQAPFNLLDRRLVTSGWLERLAGDGVEVHVRSVFLQGLLLMPSAGRAPAFGRWSSLWEGFDAWIAQGGVTPVEACLRDALTVPGISRVVVGVDSVQQLTEILAAADGPVSPLPDTLRTEDPDLLNPARWGLIA